MPAHQKRTAHRDSSLSGNLPGNKSLHGPGGRSRDTEALRHCSSDERGEARWSDSDTGCTAERGREREGAGRGRGRDFLSICTHNQFGLSVYRGLMQASRYTLLFSGCTANTFLKCDERKFYLIRWFARMNVGKERFLRNNRKDKTFTLVTVATVWLFRLNVQWGHNATTIFTQRSFSSDITLRVGKSNFVALR